ncbi:chaperone protein DnaJ [Spirochaetota bacterium]|nr:chaperone protein DnaJ [Spirochaetota bacterium]
MPAATKDFYNILGVSRGASKDEIKRAYRRKAIESHPDRNKGNKQAEERFKDINEAYSILSDDKKKQIYDQYGYEALRRGAGNAGGAGANFTDMNFSSFSEFFEEAFGADNIFDNFFNQGGSAQNRSTRSRGTDIQYELEVSLEQAFNGTSYDFDLSKKVACTHCNGTGARKGTSPSRCEDCNGNGQIRQNRGIFSINTTCPSCRGEGVIIENPCHSCSGHGVVTKKKQVKVKIPPGIADGQSIRITGEGSISRRGGSAGDLYFKIRVRPDDHFERENDNLYCNAHVNIPQAVLGAVLHLKNLNNETIKITLHPGIQHGDILRIKHKGMPKLQRTGDRGDLMIRIHIIVPKKLDRKTEQLYRNIAELTKDNDTISLSKIRTKKSFWSFRSS